MSTLYANRELRIKQDYLRSQLHALTYLPRPYWDERLIQIAREFEAIAADLGQ